MASSQPAALARLRGIYAIVNDGPRDPIALTRSVLAGGIRVVQFRVKRGIRESVVRALRVMTREQHALLILNDDWRAAAALDSDGVHLGPDDGAFDALEPVRAALGDRLIGLSCGTPDEARHAARVGADYIGVGAVYATANKSDAGAPIGLDGLRAIVAAAPTLPAVAIGGIVASRLADVRACGAAMAAVIGAIDCDDPKTAASELIEAWDEHG